MSPKPLVVLALAALGAPAFAGQIPKPLSTIGAIPSGRIRCHGISSVTMTADPEQTLPLQVAATLPCDEPLAILADPDGYTLHVRTTDGKTGYVARIYVAKDPVAAAPEEKRSAAVVNGVARWQPGAPGSEQLLSDYLAVESLTVEGVTVQVSLHDTGWKLRASVAVVNSGNQPLEIRPSDFRLEERLPAIRSLAYLAPSEMARAANHQVLWTSANASAGASPARTVDGPYRGSFQLAAYRQTSPVYLPRQPELDNTGKQIRASALHAGTVEPGGQSSGAVWFERDTKAQELLLRVPVGGVIYEFPLTFGRD